MGATAWLTVIGTVALVGLVAWRFLSPRTFREKTFWGRTSPRAQGAIVFGYGIGLMLGILFGNMIFVAIGLVCGSVIAMWIDAQRKPTVLP